MPRSKKLTRQISRYLGSATAEEDLLKLSDTLQAISPDVLPSGSREALANLPSLLDIVDESYAKYEENLVLSDRNLAVSTNELMEANRSVHLMVNSLGQGFLMFDKTGRCSSIYSKACERLLGVVPAGQHISSVLHLEGEKQKRFTSLLRFAFDSSHAMSFEEIVHFAPRSLVHAHGQHIRLDYKPERSEDGELEQIIVIATDVTEQIRAEELAQERKDLFQSIECVLRDRQSFGSYIRRAHSFVDSLTQAKQSSDLLYLRRELHTLKGGAGAFRLIRLMNAMHDTETAIANFSEYSPQGMHPQSLVMHQALLKEEIDDIIDRFKNILDIDVLALETERNFSKQAIFDFAFYLKRQGQNALYEEYIRRVCTESLQEYMRRFDLHLRDLAERFNKKVHPIVFTGDDVMLVTEAYHSLFHSFVHVFRNIMDHGIEPPYDRQLMGKSETGSIEIHLSRSERNGRPWLEMEIKDDGAGIDTVKLRAKLAAQNPQDNWEHRSEDDVLNSIFTQNLSTSNTVTLYSGRGMGMSAVYEEVKKLDGNITIKSIRGKGTSLRVEIPYRLEIE